MNLPRASVLSVIALSLASSALAASGLSALIPPYEQVSVALAADDLAGARTAARHLADDAKAGGASALAADARSVAGAADLTTARTAFKTLSLAVVPIARHHKGWFIINCPMAGADWVQSTRTIANPYLGRSMSSCGTVKEETKG